MSGDSKFFVRCRDEAGNEYTETVRTSRHAAEDDVRIIKDICGRAAWIEEGQTPEGKSK